MFVYCFENDHSDEGGVFAHEIWTLEVGGDGGDRFLYRPDYGNDNFIISGIKVWYNDNYISKIEVETSAGALSVFGHEDGCESYCFAFDKGETIRALKLWPHGEGEGTHLGRIWFETSNNRVFNGQPPHYGNSEERDVDVGNGICVGIFGSISEDWHGADIGSLGFIFLKDLPDVSPPLEGV